MLCVSVNVSTAIDVLPVRTRRATNRATRKMTTYTACIYLHVTRSIAIFGIP
ncbi:hypothetical protein OESDEN_22186 [Oesophagostomum dentatum]|uniref:Uncharacterized protein n=1 Tax=Oesophagostomum dentatum TaxID=61180 RepID=A0A0B1RZU8_OESDE|nr:hypothetical protein OESDEN_22186 [Oesophagostomum dentatum]